MPNLWWNASIMMIWKRHDQNGYWKFWYNLHRSTNNMHQGTSIAYPGGMKDLGQLKHRLIRLNTLKVTKGETWSVNQTWSTGSLLRTPDWSRWGFQETLQFGQRSTVCQKMDQTVFFARGNILQREKVSWSVMKTWKKMVNTLMCPSNSVFPDRANQTERLPVWSSLKPAWSQTRQCLCFGTYNFTLALIQGVQISCLQPPEPVWYDKS